MHSRRDEIISRLVIKLARNYNDPNIPVRSTSSSTSSGSDSTPDQKQSIAHSSQKCSISTPQY